MIQWEPFDFFNAHTFATRCGQIFHAFASQKGQQGRTAIEMQRQKRSSRRRFFADMEVVVESSPVPA
jgi:hypothetical protein